MIKLHVFPHWQKQFLGMIFIYKGVNLNNILKVILKNSNYCGSVDESSYKI